MEIKFGEKYELKQDKEYFCIQLQRMVKFTSRVCVELESRSEINYYDPEEPNFVYFGKLIDLNRASGPDYVTENMIEFKKDDIVGTYTMSKGMFLYMDFVENEKV